MNEVVNAFQVASTAQTLRSEMNTPQMRTPSIGRDRQAACADRGNARDVFWIDGATFGDAPLPECFLPRPTLPSCDPCQHRARPPSAPASSWSKRQPCSNAERLGHRSFEAPSKRSTAQSALSDQPQCIFSLGLVLEIGSSPSVLGCRGSNQHSRGHEERHHEARHRSLMCGRAFLS